MDEHLEGKIGAPTDARDLFNRQLAGQNDPFDPQAADEFDSPPLAEGHLG